MWRGGPSTGPTWLPASTISATARTGQAGDHRVPRPGRTGESSPANSRPVVLVLGLGGMETAGVGASPDQGASGVEPVPRTEFVQINVDVVPRKRREAGHVLVADIKAVRAPLVDGGVHMAGVEEHERVEGQAQGADLILHAVLAALAELPGAAVEDLPGEGVTALLEVGHDHRPGTGQPVRT